jgi:hypothetical protein
VLLEPHHYFVGPATKQTVSSLVPSFIYRLVCYLFVCRSCVIVSFLNFISKKGFLLFLCYKPANHRGASLVVWSRKGCIVSFVTLSRSWYQYFDSVCFSVPPPNPLFRTTSVLNIQIYNPMGDDHGMFRKKYPSRERLDFVMSSFFFMEL